MDQLDAVRSYVLNDLPYAHQYLQVILCRSTNYSASLPLYFMYYLVLPGKKVQVVKIKLFFVVLA